MNHTQVFFFTVKEAGTKLQVLTQTAMQHLRRKAPLGIIAADSATREFVDHLLWSQPKESFLPHALQYPCKELIFLSSSLVSVPFLFNLDPSPITPISGLKVIYEIEDLTHPRKADLFQQKLRHYQQLNIRVSSHESAFAHTGR